MGSWRKSRVGFLVIVLVAIAAAASTSAPASESSDRLTASCPQGSKPATIAGKFKCLRTGQRCLVRYQRTYRKYGFHCVNGRLRKGTAAKPPAPAPEPPATPPPAPAPPGQAGHFKGLTSQLTTFEFDVASDGWSVSGIKTGQINEGCTPPAHISGNIYDFGSNTLRLSTDGDFTLDYPHQSWIDFPDVRVTTSARITINGHVSGSSATGDLQLSVTFVYQGVPFSCGSGLQTWTAMRVG
jgi:hypothetical protein